jgi:hypothetical protein
MIAIIPLVAGVVLGLTTARRTALIAQAAFYVLGAVTLVITAPRHDASYGEGAVLALALLPLAAISLGVGVLIRSRRDNSPAGSVQ